MADIKLAAGFRNGPFQGLSLDKKMALAHKLGLNMAEVNLLMVWRHDSKYQFTDFLADELLWVKEQLRPLSRITVHGPYGVSINSYNRLYRQLSIQQIKDCIQFAAAIGAPLIATHLEPTWPRIEFEGHAKELLIDTLREIGEYAQTHNVRLAIETQYPYPAAAFVDLIAETDHPHIGATLDTGHLFIKEVPYNSYVSQADLTGPDGPQIYNTAMLDLAMKLGDMQKLWHLHLNERRKDSLGDHFPIGTGFIDFPSLFTYLKQIQYQGSLVLELNQEVDGTTLTVDSLASSIEAARTYWEAD